MRLPVASLALAFLASPILVQAQAAKYLKLNKDGTGNILFSTTPIKKNEEAKNAFRTSFRSSDTIYARAYFSRKVGEFSGEEEGFIDLWIDGKHAKRLNFTNKDVPADRDQMVVYLYNTKDFTPDFKEEVWSGLEAGEHRMKLVVGRTRFLRKGATAEVQGDKVVVRRDDPHKAEYLSDSDFTFVVE